MTEAASELRTFLIADIRGYTRFTAEHGDEAGARLAGRFADLTEEGVNARGGRVVELRGDEALAVFGSARQALHAALDLQRRFAEECARTEALPLRVGMGLDAGEAIPIKGGYRGGALNLAARLCSLAGPGEVLASEGVTHLARKMDGVEYAERGAMALKGFAEPVRVIQVSAADTAPVAAAAGNEKADTTGLERDLPIGGFLGSLPAGPLVAREEELRRVREAIDVVAAGEGRLVLLAGEPGVGKTRLAQEATLAARNRDFLIATGRCYEPQQGVPFYPFLEVLARLYAVAPAGIQSEAERRWPYLARLLPDEIPARATVAGDPQEEQLRLFRTVTSFLQAIAETTPIALLLDDVHWADGSSLALLQHVTRHTRASRILLLGTYRDVEVNPDHSLERALLDLSRERLLERIRLRRLEEHGTAEMIVATLGQAETPPELADLIHSRTDGNPFFVEEIVRALVERGDLQLEDGRWVRQVNEDIEVPESVRSVITQRVGRLGQAAQEALLEASIFGPAFSFDDLQAIAERSEEELESILEETIAAGLLQEAGRDTYAFNHALTQQSLYARLSSRRRRRLHLAAGEALEVGRKSGRRAAGLAWHFLEGDDPERALRYSLVAGDEARAVPAHAEAERHYRTAVELARELEDEAREAEAREKLGVVYANVARYEEAREHLEAAAAVYRRHDDNVGETRVTIELGHVHRGRGAADQGVAVVQAALQRLEGTARPEDVAELCIILETLYFSTGRYEDGLRIAERARDLATASRDRRALARAEVSRGTELMMLGHSEARDVLEGALTLAEQIDDAYNLVRLLINLGNVYERTGEIRRSADLLARALEIEEGLENPWGIAFCLCNLGSVCRELGEWHQARTHLERAVAMGRAAGTTWWGPYTLYELGILHVDTGDWERATALLTEALEAGQRGADVQLVRAASGGLAKVDLQRGEATRAVGRLEPLLDRSDFEEEHVTQLLPQLGEAYVAAGDREQSEHTVEDALRRASGQGYRHVIAETLLIRGRLRGEQGRWDDASADLEEALRLARAMSIPLMEGRVLREIGLQAVLQGRLGAAQEHLARALEIFWRLGARADIKEAEQALDRLKSRPA